MNASDGSDPTNERARAFAQRLRQTRKRQGLKQKELADLAGLSPAAISQLETGERRPNFATLVSLAEALRTTPNSLMGVVAEDTDEPQLRALFRKLEGLSQKDVSAVEGFVAYLRREKDEG